MAARNPDNLPEGTDHIVNGAMGTNGAAGSPTGGSTGTGTGTGTASGGFVASGGTNDTGGTAENRGGIKGQLRSGAQTLKSQASDRARNYAVDGKAKATDKLDDLARVVEDAARSIDERLGSEYGEYARKAATYVSDFSSNVRSKDVDELLDDTRALIRKSPAAALGIAAVVGFTLVRLVKAGLDENATSGSASSTGVPTGSQGV